MEKPTEKKILLDCRDVSLGYEGQALWRGLTFQVRSGDYLCVVGENGSGKSTLLKSMLGLLPPMKGEIVLATGPCGREPSAICPSRPRPRGTFPPQ